MHPIAVQLVNAHPRLTASLMLGGLILTIAAAISISTPAMAEKHVSYQVPFSLGLGKGMYDGDCAECHGAWAEGSDKGPPLIHPYYVPGHHGDAAFYRAIAKGTKQHHWKFGDMPARTDIDLEKAPSLVKYIRWLQAQNGIK